MTELMSEHFNVTGTGEITTSRRIYTRGVDNRPDLVGTHPFGTSQDFAGLAAWPGTAPPVPDCTIDPGMTWESRWIGAVDTAFGALGLWTAGTGWYGFQVVWLASGGERMAGTARWPIGMLAFGGTRMDGVGRFLRGLSATGGEVSDGTGQQGRGVVAAGGERFNGLAAQGAGFIAVGGENLSGRAFPALFVASGGELMNGLSPNASTFVANGGESLDGVAQHFPAFVASGGERLNGIAFTWPMPILLDFFTAADGTNLALHPMDIGPGWTLQGQWEIQSNQAENTITGVEFRSQTQSYAGVSDVRILSRVRTPPSGFGVGVCWRLTDFSNYTGVYIAPGTGVVVIEEWVGGLLQTYLPFTHPTTSDTYYDLTVVLTGRATNVFIDNALVITVDLSFRTHASRHGLFNLNSPDSRWDYFVAWQNDSRNGELNGGNSFFGHGLGARGGERLNGYGQMRQAFAAAGGELLDGLSAIGVVFAAAGGELGDGLAVLPATFVAAGGDRMNGVAKRPLSFIANGGERLDGVATRPSTVVSIGGELLDGLGDFPLPWFADGGEALNGEALQFHQLLSNLAGDGGEELDGEGLEFKIEVTSLAGNGGEKLNGETEFNPI